MPAAMFVWLTMPLPEYVGIPWMSGPLSVGVTFGDVLNTIVGFDGGFMTPCPDGSVAGRDPSGSASRSVFAEFLVNDTRTSSRMP